MVRALAALAAGSTPSKRARRKEAHLLALRGRAPDHLLKLADARPLPFWRRLAPSRAHRALACAERLAACGVAAPVPVAVGERRRWLLLERSYEIVPWLGDAVDLARVLAEQGLPFAERRAVECQLGALVRALHEAGVDQDDLAPNNFLWRRGAEPALFAVDFERARLRDRVPEPARIAALAKLARYATAASSASRMRFLVAYARDDRAAARRLWRAIEAAAAQLLRADVRRWSRASRPGGRRFETLDACLPARGRVRRGIERTGLGEALGGAQSARWLVVDCVGSAESLLGVALALDQRGLGLRPDAAVERDGRTRIAFARPPDVARLDDPSRARAALGTALARLLALGVRAEEPIDACAFAARADGERVWVVDPGIVRLVAVPDAAPLQRRARSLALRVGAPIQVAAPR